MHKHCAAKGEGRLRTQQRRALLLLVGVWAIAVSALHQTNGMNSDGLSSTGRLLLASTKGAPPAKRPPPPPPPAPPVVSPRLEIYTLSQMPERNRYRILLLLAWQRMYQLKPSDPWSYQQIAGIHGAPFVPYNSTYGVQQAMGYCYHESTLFATWHRPYLAHLERSLIMQAKAVANSFVNVVERAAYQRIAPSVRLPYFDSANPYLQSDFPSLLRDEKVRVDNPKTYATDLVTISNPLYSFVFRDEVPTDTDIVPICSMGYPTVRSPDNPYNPTTNVEVFVANIQSQQGGLANDVVNLMAAGSWDCLYNSRGGFCSMGVATLEQMHNGLHGGVAGHMGSVPTSAFDPLFHLHHANVDRLFWLWQQRFPDVWVQPAQEGGNFYTPPGSIDASTPLAPFWKNGKSLFTSNDVRDLKRVFHTTFAPPPGGNTFRRRLTSSGQNSSSERHAVGQQAPEEVWQDTMRLYGGGYKGYRWQVNLDKLNAYQLGTPFYVHIFLNKAHASSSPRCAKLVEARAEPTYCASYYSFSQSMAPHQHKHNPKERVTIPTKQQLAHATVDITQCLIRHGMDPNKAPRVEGSPHAGPAVAPIQLSDLSFSVGLRNGTVVTDRFKFGQTTLSWTCTQNGKLSSGQAP